MDLKKRFEELVEEGYIFCGGDILRYKDTNEYYKFKSDGELEECENCVYTNMDEAEKILYDAERFYSVDYLVEHDAITLMQDIFERKDAKELVEKLLFQRRINFPFDLLEHRRRQSKESRRQKEELGEKILSVFEELANEVLSYKIPEDIDLKELINENNYDELERDDKYKELCGVIRKAETMYFYMESILGTTGDKIPEKWIEMKKKFIGDGELISFNESNVHGSLTPYVLLLNDIRERNRELAEEYYRKNEVREKCLTISKFMEEKETSKIGGRNLTGCFDTCRANLKYAKAMNSILDTFIKCEQGENTDQDVEETYKKIRSIIDEADEYSNYEFEEDIARVIICASERGSKYAELFIEDVRSRTATTKYQSQNIARTIRGIEEAQEDIERIGQPPEEIEYEEIDDGEYFSNLMAQAEEKRKAKKGKQLGEEYEV